MKSVQTAQNKLMRMLINASYNDRTSTSVLLKETGLLSVNQLAASIKLCDIWKAVNLDNYPTKVMQRIPNINFTQTRATSNGIIIEKGKSNIAQATLINDGTKAWNRAPKEVHQSLSYNIAKKKN